MATRRLESVIDELLAAMADSDSESLDPEGLSNLRRTCKQSKKKLEEVLRLKNHSM